MNRLKLNWRTIATFFQSAKESSKNVLIVHGFILIVMIPLVTGLTKMILKGGNIAYLSFDNIFPIIKSHPFVLLGLLLMMCLMALMIFFEFTFLLLSIYFIRKKEPLHLRTLLRLTFQQFKHVFGSEILFLLFYFFLILPFAGIGFKTALLAKIKIPVFIMDYLFEYRLIFVPLLGLGYLICVYIGIRLLLVLPMMILYHLPLKEAIRRSWKLTKDQFWTLIRKLILLTVALSIMVGGSYLVIFFLQDLIETHYASAALVSGVVSLTLLQVLIAVRNILAMIILFYLIVDLLDKTTTSSHETFNIQPKLTPVKGNRFLILFGNLVIGSSVLIMITGMSLYNYDYLSNRSISEPLLISHRGVTNKNGAQNTIEALEKTAKEKPDYVEMDILETKDHQFVVMHDVKLKNLTGENKKVYELTLAELQKLIVSENGYEAKIPSFDDYLKKANELNQKLLIEVKVTKQDSKEMVENFIQRYQESILENNHIIHSISYDVVEELKEKSPQLYVGYVMPFNLIGPPETKADFYSAEYSTLTSDFVDEVHEQDKKLFAWDINEENSAKRMLFFGADGLITDHLVTIKELVHHDLTNELSYSDMLLNYLLGLDS